MRKTLASLFGLLILGLYSCAQEPPEDRPRLTNDAFDRKLTSLLSFKVPLIGVEELKAEREKFYLLDTREREEYEVSHIPGAKYAGYRDFDLAELKDVSRDTPVVLYCSVGYRSERIGKRLQKAGFTDVRNLYGSIFEWTNRGYPLENDQGKPVNRIHTYNKSWSRWVEDDAARKVW
jgi:rhodanese-related sulfurtransferase